MKNIIKMIIFVLCFYLVLGLCWIGEIVITHYQKVDNLPIIGYHGVVDDQTKKTKYADNIYFLDITSFDKQMKYLYDNGYYTLTMEEIEQYYHGNYDLPKKAVALTFDDGYENFNSVVKPILMKYNFHATSFVIGYKTTLDNDLYLKKDELVNDEYVEYYSHSYNLHHCAKKPYKKKIETLSTKQIIEDIKKNEGIVSTKYFAFPYGVSCKNAREALIDQNVSLAFGYNENRNMTPDDDQYLLPRYMIVDCMPQIYFEWIVE